MSALSVDQAIEAIYQSLQDENDDLDGLIKSLKAALAAQGQKEAIFETARLVQGNREGRKRMQSYFKKRGVSVSFKAQE
tara:strand:+ start:1190 stop:1426 length:237 start_codon:yes stop_codon:yes gene_type:complete